MIRGDVIRIVLVDDQDLVRAGLERILGSEDDLTIVAQCSDGAQALEAVEATHPDVVVMDIRMPVMDGIEATRRITRTDGGPRVIVLTTFDGDEHVVEALRAGASGFLLKDVPPDEFVRALRIVAGGEALIAPSVTRRLLERFARLAVPADETHGERLRGLTEREHEVLHLVAQGLANREIADRLALAEPTVKTHVSHLLLKLDVRDRAQLVMLAYELGVVRPGAPG